MAPPYSSLSSWTPLATLTLLWASLAWTEGRPACPSCGMPSLEPSSEKAFLIEVAKQQILEKLHLSERPNITHPIPRVAIANALQRLHMGKSWEDGRTPVGDNAESNEQGYEIVSFAETEPSGKLQFHFSHTEGQDMRVHQAQLWLYLKTHQNITLQVSQGGRPLGEQQLETQGWHTFSLTSAVQRFFEHEEKTLFLELQCKGCHHPSLTSLLTYASGSHQPFLAVKAKIWESGHRVAKRSLNCDQNANVCCRKDYYVSFQDIGWNDWVIKPEGYQINYCMGECPIHLAGAPGMAASFHTTVFNLVKANNIQTAGRSCCVPTQRRALSLLYVDPNFNLHKKEIPDMVVDACGCS